jgi:hypothetical protein
MPLRAEQHNFVDAHSRFFYLNASIFTIPVQGYHRYTDAEATMRVKAAGLVPVATAFGPEMTKAETVTMLNDMCVMAPATLIDPAIQWEDVDALTATAVITNAGYTVRARLSFNAAGELTNFVSHDRYQASADGTSGAVPWSTPVSAYRTFAGVRVPSAGEGWWHEPNGEYPYIQLTIDDVEYNVQIARRRGVLRRRSAFAMGNGDADTAGPSVARAN